ncbi:HPr family phosphocarrier protein [Gleimia hominis]|uniref:Phosphocarrier protein HPr n=1 Tax=Gleimia hominis TaxID=595468 RepID=A0ABU3I9E2_9ACTO|nr:HPr family phosphocarrier protein [Gleimia hominis]MDT3766990.1 HPr family phosphocarrier protein [Gleimia hominis]WIK64441.1 HPr family phosphocarrier protein [Gleimia hominis]
MVKRSATVASEVGLHARPAAIIAREAKRATSPVYISLGEETVEAQSGLMIMTLGAQYGDEVTVTSDDEKAVEAVCELIASPMSSV